MEVLAVHDEGARAWQNADSLSSIVGGAAEVLVGLAMVTGTLGGGAVPGFALMALGADQIITGEVNLITGKNSSSMIEYAFYSGAKVLGGGEGGAQTAMRWGPTVLSIGLSGGFGGLVNFGRTAALAGLNGGRAVFQFTNVAGTLGIRAAEGLSTGLVAGTRSGLQAGRSVLQSVMVALEERAIIRAMQAEAAASFRVYDFQNAVAAGIVQGNTIFVYLTPTQFAAALKSGYLGYGYPGLRAFFPPFPEGRIWGTTFTAMDLIGREGIRRAASIGIEAPWLAGWTRQVVITGDAAKAFMLPWGPAFSWNPIGWLKSYSGGQFMFRGRLPFNDGPIASLAGAQLFTPRQMAVLRAAELWRPALYVGAGVAGSVGLAYWLWPRP